jgi:peptidoglycan-N-acetylglucosamine deacetylase
MTRRFPLHRSRHAASTFLLDRSRHAAQRLPQWTSHLTHQSGIRTRSWLAAVHAWLTLVWSWLAPVRTRLGHAWDRLAPPATARIATAGRWSKDQVKTGLTLAERRLEASRIAPAWHRFTAGRLSQLVQRHLNRRLATLCALVSVVSLTLACSVAAATPNHPVRVAHKLTTPSTGGQGGSLPLPGVAGGATQQPGSKGAGKEPSTNPTARIPGPVDGPEDGSGTPSDDPASPSAPASPQELPVLHSTNTSQVALTFDDGPDASTPQILALLRQYHVKATFCVIGMNIQKHYDLLQQMVADGHTLCNHTWRHDLNLGTRSPDVIRSDLQRTNDEIHLAVPDAPIKYFRHPGGNFTPAIVAIAADLGMTSLDWDVDPKDWDTKHNGTGGTMAQHITTVVTNHAHPGAIILDHDGGGNRTGTVTAYQTLLPWLLARFEMIPMPV